MTRTKPVPWVLVIGVLASSLATHPAVAGDAVTFGPHDARSVFIVAKSQNRNQVHYGVHLDAACNPVGPAPVFGYWRMLEENGAIEPILAMEEPAYGLAEQTLQRGPDGTTIFVKLRAFPDRPLALTIKQVEGRCETAARGTIAGADARVTLIYVKLRWPFGIEFILVRGRDPSNQAVEEIVRN